MSKQGKVWGETSCLIANSAVEMHRIRFKAKHRCSRHHHQTKYNLFVVISGRMVVRVWQKDYKLVDETTIGPGEHTVVKPGLDHEFVGLEDGEALELYWTELQHNDIVRTDHGGPTT